MWSCFGGWRFSKVSAPFPKGVPTPVPKKCFACVLRATKGFGDPAHARPGHATLAGGVRVAPDLAPIPMAADRRDFVGRAAGLGETATGGLSKAVGGFAGAEARLTGGADEPTGELQRLELTTVAHKVGVEGVGAVRHGGDGRAGLGHEGQH